MIKYDVYNLIGTYYRLSVDSPLAHPAEWYCPFLGAWFGDSAFDGMFILLCDRSVLVARNVVFKDKVCSQ